MDVLSLTSVHVLRLLLAVLLPLSLLFWFPGLTQSCVLHLPVFLRPFEVQILSGAACEQATLALLLERLALGNLCTFALPALVVTLHPFFTTMLV